VFLKELTRIVNVVPIIAKADTMTINELLLFKKEIITKLKEQEIEVYRFPSCKTDLDATDPFDIHPPYAVIGRLRQYAWGTADSENPKHSDISLLRDQMIAVSYNLPLLITNVA
jgi:septin family protein